MVHSTRWVNEGPGTEMYRFETLKLDVSRLVATGIVGAILIMIVMQITNEIALPGELFENTGNIVLGFALLTVMIGFIAGAFRSLAFVQGKWPRRALIALGLVGFALPMMDIGDEGGLTLVDVYEVVLPGLLLAAILIVIPQAVVASVRRLRLVFR